LGPIYPGVKMGLAEAVESAFGLDDLDKVRELLAIVDDLSAGDTTPFQRAQREQFGARLAAVEGHDDLVESAYKGAAGLFREIGTPFWLGQALLEHGEWLVGKGRDSEAHPMFEEAREVFGRLRAQPWLERVEKVAAAQTVTP